MKNIRAMLKSVIRSTGYDLHRFIPSGNLSLQLYTAMKRFQIDTVLDVGANTGQFAHDLRSVGFEGQIVSFEPLSSAHRVLSKIAKEDPKWSIHPRCAIGERDGEADINVAGNSISSSLLPMMSSHSMAEEGSAYVGAEKTPVFKLDSVSRTYVKQSSRTLLKIDTQGYEWQVLDGARNTLPAVQGILCELSLVPLYEGQRLWTEMIERIEKDGFALWVIQPGFVDNRDGRTLQFDALFFRL